MDVQRGHSFLDNEEEDKTKVRKKEISSSLYFRFGVKL